MDIVKNEEFNIYWGDKTNAELLELVTDDMVHEAALARFSYDTFRAGAFQYRLNIAYDLLDDITAAYASGDKAALEAKLDEWIEQKHDFFRRVL